MASDPTLPRPLTGLAGFVGLPTFLEPRAHLETLNLLGSDVWKLPGIPEADACSVLLVPGFMASGYSLVPLRRWLLGLGFSVELAPVGLNAGPGHSGVRRVVESLRSMKRSPERRVFIIGHSRGGQIGSVAALRTPELVDAVISLGSPLRQANPRHFLTRLPVAGIKALGSRVLSAAAVEAEAQFEADAEAPFPERVKRVSVWSRTDGVVDWRASMLGGDQDVEVRGSHFGLATNPRVYRKLHGVLKALASDG